MNRPAHARLRHRIPIEALPLLAWLCFVTASDRRLGVVREDGMLCLEPGEWLLNSYRLDLQTEELVNFTGRERMRRILNSDQTDWGLHLVSDPVVLRVSVATF